MTSRVIAANQLRFSYPSQADPILADHTQKVAKPYGLVAFFKFNVGRPAHPEMHGAEETEPHQATTQKNKREMTHGGTFVSL